MAPRDSWAIWTTPPPLDEPVASEAFEYNRAIKEAMGEDARRRMQAGSRGPVTDPGTLSRARRQAQERLRQRRIAAAKAAEAERRRKEAATTKLWQQITSTETDAKESLAFGLPQVDTATPLVPDTKPGEFQKFFGGYLEDVKNPAKKEAEDDAPPLPLKDEWQRVKKLPDAPTPTPQKVLPGWNQNGQVKLYMQLLKEYRQQTRGRLDGGAEPGQDGTLIGGLISTDQGMGGMGLAFPNLGGQGFMYALTKGKDGQFVVEDMTSVFNSYLPRLEDPESAGRLAYELNAGGFYGTEAGKRLKDRLTPFTNEKGESSFRINWTEDDFDALETALHRAGQEQASKAQRGKFVDIREIIERKAAIGKGLAVEGVGVEGEENAGQINDISMLAPGKYGGVDLDKEQLLNAHIIASVGFDMGATPQDVGIAIMAGLQESGLRNLNHGDRDSLGLFQQRPSQGWGSPEQIQTPNYAARKFFEGLMGLGAKRATMAPGAAAQAVQKSAHPEKYAKWAATAQAVLGVGALGGQAAPLKMLGDVRPHARGAAEEISATFGIDNIGGMAKSGHIPGSDHYSGKAIDVMLEGKDGNAVVSYALQNAGRLGVKDVIHNSTYYKLEGGEWKSEPYTGDNPHTGHVHVGFHDNPGQGGTGSFSAPTGSGGTYSPGSGGVDGSGSAVNYPSSGFVSDPGAVLTDGEMLKTLAAAVGREKLGRDLSPQEVAAITSAVHAAERNDWSAQMAGGTARMAPDPRGIIDSWIEENLEGEQNMQAEGDLMLAFMRMVQGGGFGGVNV